MHPLLKNCGQQLKQYHGILRPQTMTICIYELITMRISALTLLGWKLQQSSKLQYIYVALFFAGVS